jgi:hypothetical protein
MNDILVELARGIAGSPVNEFIVWSLRNVPGLPPIVQTVHLLSIAVVMGSIVMVNLKVLGVALPNQNAGEMMRRLIPWTWWALLLLLLSGLVFVIARPRRYLVNPVFGIKFALLGIAVVCTLVLQRLHRQSTSSVTIKLFAALSLCAWLGVVLAGRWIAYADYLFPPE